MLEHGALYSVGDYSRALVLLAHSDVRGEGAALEREEKLPQQLEQLETIFSGETV